MPAPRPPVHLSLSAGGESVFGHGCRRAAAACRRFWGDERGSVLVDYVALTAVMTAVGVYTEHKVGARVAQMLQAVADAFPG